MRRKFFLPRNFGARPESHFLDSIAIFRNWHLRRWSRFEEDWMLGKTRVATVIRRGGRLWFVMVRAAIRAPRMLTFVDPGRAADLQKPDIQPPNSAAGMLVIVDADAR